MIQQPLNQVRNRVKEVVVRTQSGLDPGDDVHDLLERSLVFLEILDERDVARGNKPVLQELLDDLGDKLEDMRNVVLCLNGAIGKIRANMERAGM
jgi:hypothetical protein